MLATTAPFPQYFDLDGKPLDVGYLFFGKPNQNPETAPIQIFWDQAGTQPAAQPVMTLNGYAVRRGTPALVFVDGNYSLSVRNRKGELVYYAPDSAAISNDSALQAQLTKLVDDLAGDGAGKGADMVGYDPNAEYMAGVGRKLSNTVNVNDYPGTFDGVADDTAALQSAVNARTGAVTVDLGGKYLAITTVNIPNATAVTVKNGRIKVIGAGSLGLSKRTTVSPQAGGTPAKYDLVCDNIQFERAASEGACVDVSLAWQDSTGAVVISPSCSFMLTGGAVGVRLGACLFPIISGRFNMSGSSIGVLCDATLVVPGDANPVCPMDGIVDHASFSGGTAFTTRFVAGSVWNSFEGFSFGPGCRFYDSKLNFVKYNLVKILGSHLVSANAVFDSGYNTIITGGYTDRNTAAQGPLLTFKTTVRTSQQIYIGGGFQCNAQGSAGDLILFSDAGSIAGGQITNVTIDGVSFVGGMNDPANKIIGIKCDHNALRNLNFTGAATFQNLYAALSFAQAINRSTIKAFEARDLTWYAENVAVGYGGSGNYNRFDGVYKVYEAVEMFVPTYISSAQVDISTAFLPHESMMRAPLVTISAQTDPFGAGFFDIYTGASYRNGVQLRLRKNATAPGNTRGGQIATVTLDASKYVAPL